MRGAKRGDGFINSLPDLFAQLNAFKVLREIVEPRKQAERIPKRRPCRLTEARGNSHPCLLTEFDHDAVFNCLNADGEGGLPAGHRAGARGDLDCHFILLPDGLRV